MKKHGRHDRTEIRRLLEVRRSERLTYEQLSERSGVPVHVLSYRAAQDRRERPDGKGSRMDFAEIVPAAEPGARINSSGIELVLPCGLHALLDLQFDESALARLLAVTQC